MQSYPLVPGNEGHNSVFARVSPERTVPIVSDLQLGVMADIRVMQAAARENPILNGEDARRRLRGGGAA